MSRIALVSLALGLAAASPAQETVRPDHLVWVVVGDRSKIEAGLRELNWGEIRFLDADGKPLAAR
jgi:zinc protease